MWHADAESWVKQMQLVFLHLHAVGVVALENLTEAIHHTKLIGWPSQGSGGQITDVSGGPAT
jgi:hypothetical protein